MISSTGLWPNQGLINIVKKENIDEEILRFLVIDKSFQKEALKDKKILKDRLDKMKNIFESFIKKEVKFKQDIEFDEDIESDDGMFYDDYFGYVENI